MIGEFIYMLLSDMNLRIGKVKNYNNKILISSPSYKIGTNLKINIDDEKDKPVVKSKKEPDIKSNKEHIQDVQVIKTKPDIESNKKQKPGTESNKEHKPEPDMNKITCEEEKVALILGITSIFTVWWLFK